MNCLDPTSSKRIDQNTIPGRNPTGRNPARTRHTSLRPRWPRRSRQYTRDTRSAPWRSCKSPPGSWRRSAGHPGSCTCQRHTVCTTLQRPSTKTCPPGTAGSCRRRSRRNRSRTAGRSASQRSAPRCRPRRKCRRPRPRAARTCSHCKRRTRPRHHRGHAARPGTGGS